MLNETSLVVGANPLNQINPIGLVRLTRVQREAQKMMKMFQKTGGKGLGKLLG